MSKLNIDRLWRLRSTLRAGVMLLASLLAAAAFLSGLEGSLGASL
jgi:hypothetical protein